MAIGIGIDVYGTLVDPLEMNAHLRPLVGAAAEKLAELCEPSSLNIPSAALLWASMRTLTSVQDRR